MWDAEMIDARGLLCPLPLLRLQQVVRVRQAGCKLWLQSTDPATPEDVVRWCRVNRHRVAHYELREGVHHVLVEVGAR